MMSIAKLINIMQEEGSKKNPPLPIAGEVISTLPLKIKSKGIVLDDDQLYPISDTFTIGQTVILFPTSNKKFAVAKVVE